jgi:hypothetical protein
MNVGVPFQNLSQGKNGGRGFRYPGELLTSIAILELAELLEKLNAPVVAQTCATGHFFRSTFAEHYFGGGDRRFL